MLLDTLISLLGIAMVLLVLEDFINTTLRLKGGGRLTNAITNATWRLMLYLHHRRPHGRILYDTGVTGLLLTILTWTTLLWLGWLLVFLPHEAAVESSPEGADAGVWSRAYFVGYSLITLGVGDYAPAGPLFQMATVFAAITGFFLMTLSVTYLVPVVAAVVEARTLAARILLTGETPQELISDLAGLDHGRAFVRSSVDYLGPILALSQRRFAYPVLRLFPSYERDTSIAVALATLDEALTLLLLGTRDPGTLTVQLTPLRRAIEKYLYSQPLTDDERLVEEPPVPSREPLRQAGLEPIPAEEFSRRVHGLAERRRLLLAVLRQEDRAWSDVSNGDPESS